MILHLLLFDVEFYLINIYMTILLNMQLLNKLMSDDPHVFAGLYSSSSSLFQLVKYV